jgi:hypothetical protein
MPPTKKITVAFVALEDGEYLYDENTGKLYTCKAPHKFVRYVNHDTHDAEQPSMHSSNS